MELLCYGGTAALAPRCAKENLERDYVWSVVVLPLVLPWPERPNRLQDLVVRTAGSSAPRSAGCTEIPDTFRLTESTSPIARSSRTAGSTHTRYRWRPQGQA